MASSYVDAVPGGGAFLSAKPKSIFTPEDFDSDSLLMIDTAKQFMRGEVMPVLDRLDKQEDGLMPSLLRKAGELGLAGPETRELLTSNLAVIERGGLCLAPLPARSERRRGVRGGGETQTRRQ